VERRQADRLQEPTTYEGLTGLGRRLGRSAVITLYLDSSSLIKLYVAEDASDEVRQDLSGSDTVATSSVSYAETRAAFARLRRNGKLTPPMHLAAKRDFDADWSSFAIIEPTTALCRAAGELAERYSLQGCDSIQLASCLQLARETAETEVRFSSFDRQLNRAATLALRAQRR
jgi:predicted nucleic acid-binding protein